MTHGGPGLAHSSSSFVWYYRSTFVGGWTQVVIHHMTHAIYAIYPSHNSSLIVFPHVVEGELRLLRVRKLRAAAGQPRRRQACSTSQMSRSGACPWVLALRACHGFAAWLLERESARATAVEGQGQAKGKAVGGQGQAVESQGQAECATC